MCFVLGLCPFEQVMVHSTVCASAVFISVDLILRLVWLLMCDTDVLVHVQPF